MGNPESLIGKAKITRRVQITLPKKVRKELGGTKEGQYILFYKDGNKICIQKGEISPIK